MSSLSGIRFISKNERLDTEKSKKKSGKHEKEREDKKKSSRKKSKKEKKSKHKKEIKHSSKNSPHYDSSSSSSSSHSSDFENRKGGDHKHGHGLKRSRDRNRDRGRDSDSESDKDENGNFDVLKEEARMNELIEKELMEQQESMTKKRRFNVHSDGESDKEDREEEDRDVDNEEDRPQIVELPNDYEQLQNNEPIPEETQPNISTNQGYAALLRARLKNPPTNIEPLSKTLNTSKNTSTSHPPSASDITFMSKEEMKWMSSYTRRTSDNSNGNPDDATNSKSSTSSRYKILDDREDDIDSIIASNILKKGANFKGTELGLSGVSMSREGVGTGDRSGKDEGNENGDGEIDMKMLISKERKLTDADIAKKILNNAEKTGKIYAQIVENCSRCPKSRFYRSHRTICSGRHVELRIKPNTFSLDPGWHCELVPIPHIPSILRSLDNDADGEDGQGILCELERFKSCLIAMFERDGRGVAFMETAIHAGLKSDESGGSQRVSKHHTVIDVIPFEQGMQSEISMFFYQAFQSSGEEWSTHKTRILTINNQHPLHKVIPSRFPYISVEWSTEISPSSGSQSKSQSMSQESTREGVAHVVEDSSYFTNHFCLDVIAGALDIDPFILRKISTMKKKSSGNDQQSSDEDERIERTHVDSFRGVWSSFDWTQYVE